ncbi:MAG: hypothetical protein HOH13_06360 [Crocinitomicaceae bacterium]|nr:hypothetical protein [Crocinitomicaceae bacterium]
MKRYKSYIKLLAGLAFMGLLVSFAPDQKEDKKKKSSKGGMDAASEFKSQVAGYRQACKAALKPFRYSFGRTTYFNYKPYNTMKEVEVALILNSDYKFTFNADGVTVEPIQISVYNKPASYNNRILIFEKKSVSGGSFEFTSEKLLENMRNHYKEKGLSDYELEKILLSKVYVDYTIPAIDEEFEEDPDTGRRKVVVKRGAIVFASGYENLGYK